MINIGREDPTIPKCVFICVKKINITISKETEFLLFVSLWSLDPNLSLVFWSMEFNRHMSWYCTVTYSDESPIISRDHYSQGQAIFFVNSEKPWSASADRGMEERKMLKAVDEVCIPSIPTDNCIKVNWVGSKQNCKLFWNGFFWPLSEMMQRFHVTFWESAWGSRSQDKFM